MKIFEKAKELNTSESEKYYIEQAKRNSHYMIILSISLIVIETCILIYGLISGYHKEKITIALLCFYFLIILSSAILLSVTLHLQKDIKKNYKKVLILSVTYAFIMLIIGDIITNLDNINEQNSNNIIVCLIVILGFSTIVYLPKSVYPILLGLNFLALLIPDLCTDIINYNIITYLNLTIYSLTALVAIAVQHSQNRKEIISQIMVNTQSEQLRVLNNQLLIQAKTDGLTNLYNRSYFNVRYKELWDEAVVENKTFNTCLIDIDNFKSINDTYGHLIGDKVLRQIATLIKEESNKIDGLSFRYGGEEFLIVALNLNITEIKDAMEDLRKKVNEISLFDDANNVSITIGISSVTAFQSLNCYQILSEADQALYYGKEHGKNAVTIYTDVMCDTNNN